MKKLQVLYITAFFAACLVPSLGMAVTKQEASSENRRLAEFPELKRKRDQYPLAAGSRRIFSGTFCVSK